MQSAKIVFVRSCPEYPTLHFRFFVVAAKRPLSEAQNFNSPLYDYNLPLQLNQPVHFRNCNDALQLTVVGEAICIHRKLSVSFAKILRSD